MVVVVVVTIVIVVVVDVIVILVRYCRRACFVVLAPTAEVFYKNQ